MEFADHKISFQAHHRGDYRVQSTSDENTPLVIKNCEGRSHHQKRDGRLLVRGNSGLPMSAMTTDLP